MSESDDVSVGRVMRVMSVMDVSPGTAGLPEIGVPIGILTLATRGGEIEKPLMFSMAEVRRLAVGFMAVWAHHEGGIAAEIFTRHFGQEADFGERPAGCDWNTPAGDLPSTEAGRPAESVSSPAGDEKVRRGDGGRPAETSGPAGPILVAQFRAGKIRPLSLRVLGGYKCPTTTMLLVESDDFGDVQFLVKLKPRAVITLKGHADDELLPETEWPKLRSSSTVTCLRLRKRFWKKLSPVELQVIAQKKFWVTAPKLKE